MLPSVTNGANSNGSASAQNTPPVRDTRSFQYRFSMGYVRSLPEAQRPVEREVFGTSFPGANSAKTAEAALDWQTSTRRCCTLQADISGPFPVQQLTQWRNTGFFGGPACENVELRTAGADPGPWGSWEAVVGK